MLREQLGTGMVDTKKALEEADGDVDKATEIVDKANATLQAGVDKVNDWPSTH